MTHDEIAQARKTLGLTISQFGKMLDINDERTMRAHLTSPDRSRYRKPSARMVRLIKAYLAGYRPDDWPVETDPKQS